VVSRRLVGCGCSRLDERVMRKEEDWRMKSFQFEIDSSFSVPDECRFSEMMHAKKVSFSFENLK